MGYGGDQIGQKVIRFDKGPKNKVFLRTISYAVYAKDSTTSMFSSVNNSNVQPIAAAFDIKAFSKDSAGLILRTLSIAIMKYSIMVVRLSQI